MLLAPFKVVLDACVLFPFTLRDTLLRAASKELYQVYWSEQILAEARRNLGEKGIMTEAQADHLFGQMLAVFPEAMISGHEPLIDAMQNDAKDRHVVAAAVKAGAQVIVTENLRDFRSLPRGIEAQSSDDFLCNLLDLDQSTMLGVVVAQARALRRPPRTLEDVLAALAKVAPGFVAGLRERALG